ncbi:MAG TPA: helix-turn-helix domain-containing protein, partial [Rhizomicrobium sp.]|nr:helix-turn-helix domain-containing protein [Rhizomicrobium sp.]
MLYEPRPSARVKTVAKLLEIDASQVRRMVADGSLEAHRIGKRGIRIFLDSVQAWQDATIIQPTRSLTR